jgi:hypothetical protein
MKIGVNLVGVSYNNGASGRYRNYEDAVHGFMKNVVDPLKEEGHDIKYYIYSYDNVKRNDILNTYQPTIKHEFINPIHNTIGGGDRVSNGYKAISSTYIGSLEQLKNEDLDFIISTRFDINFFKNPFKEYPFDFTKFNFLWREPEFIDLPIVNDTFIVFPYSMLDNVIESIKEMETNPPHGVSIAMHNWYLPMVNQVGEGNVKWVCDKFVKAIDNDLYKLMRHE